MRISRIRLSRFRNYPSLDMEPSPGLNVLVGENAQGKSNLLEAVYMLATTKSFRAGKDSEVIMSGEEEATATASLLRDGEIETDIEVTISGADRKACKINGMRRPRAVDLLGALNAVFFGALDLRLVTGEPAARRRYMDLAISQMSPRYCFDLAYYKRSLDQRNRLLRELREHYRRDSGLEAWNEQLVRYGTPVICKRREFADELALLADQAHGALSCGQETLSVGYVASVRHPWTPEASESDRLEAIGEAYREQMHEVAEHEIRRGTTLVGPQRDDLRFRINDMDARSFGSQGQQRTVVLSLKMAELEFMARHVGEPPVMLLDDVMSDLDDERRARLMERVNGRCQTFVTCTNLRAFPADILEGARVYRVRAGELAEDGVGPDV